MELLVLLEDGHVGESVGAVGTGEGSLASVCVAVAGEVGGLGKGCAAVRALVWPPTHVQAVVLLQHVLV